MRSKARLILKFIYSIYSLPFISLWNCFGINWNMPVAVSHKALLKTYKAGKIYLGRYCEIEENTKIYANSGEITIGNNVYINRNGTIVSHKLISIGAGTTIGPNVVIYDHDHDYRNKKGFISSSVIIEENVWIGANVIILKGVRIGKNSVIGAGCVVTKSIPEGVIIVNEINQNVIKINK